MWAAENRLIVPARKAIMEVKANERVPYWFTDLTAARNLQVVRVSKYCQSVEAYGLAPTLDLPHPRPPRRPGPVDFTFQDLSGTFSVADIAIAMSLSFVLSAMIGWIYRATHRNVSYSQSYAADAGRPRHARIAGSCWSSARTSPARSRSSARCRWCASATQIKETRDVGFIFLVMGVGMAVGTRFYLLAVVAGVAISLIIVVMHRFNWFALNTRRQVVKVQVPSDDDYTQVVQDVLIRHTDEFELVSMESIRGGALVELMYTVKIKKGHEPGTSSPPCANAITASSSRC